MTTVQDILTYLNTIAPPELAEPWDNTGFQLGNRNTPVETILVALDPFEAVCQEAVDVGAQLLITHHPLLFSPTVDLTEDTAKGRCIRMLLQNGISQISAHTDLDIAPGGVNDVLAHHLGLQDIQVIGPENLLRWGTVNKQPIEEFLKTVKSLLGCPVLRYADGGKPVHQVAVGGGACGSELAAAIAAGCDTFVTSDVKYNQFWDAADQSLTIIDSGHFYTENPVCAYLADSLARQFPDISVKISQNHRDCMKFF